MRQASDGWHALLRHGGVEHRAWFAQEPGYARTFAAQIALDDKVEARAHAATQLWRAITGRRLKPAFCELPIQRRDRLVQSLQALDGHLAGADYRAIVVALFGRASVPEAGWKTHDLRSRTVRLVQSGVRIANGGYRDLLTYPAGQR